MNEEPSSDQENNQERRQHTVNPLRSVDNQPPKPSTEIFSRSPSSSVVMADHSHSLSHKNPPHSQPLSQSQPTHPNEPTEYDMPGVVISGHNRHQQPHDHNLPSSQLQWQSLLPTSIRVSQELPPVTSYLPLDQGFNQETIRMAPSMYTNQTRPLVPRLVPRGQQMMYPWAPPLYPLPSPPPPQALQEAKLPPGHQLMNPRAPPPFPRSTQPPPPPSPSQSYYGAEPTIERAECLVAENFCKVRARFKCPCCQSKHDLQLEFKKRDEN